ncbi:MAG: NUDIX hydrolase [Pseudonocardiaceae bacterium]
MSATSMAPRLGARVLLLDPLDRVRLIHAHDPDDPGHHWWELPCGGLEEGEDLADAAHRELAEESGILLRELGRKLWVRESRFTYRGRAHHRIEHAFLGHTPSTLAHVPLKPTENEKAGPIERRWWTAAELGCCSDKFLPANLPELLDDLLGDRISDSP